MAARLGLLFVRNSANISPIWPAAGVTLYLILRFGIRAWPGIAIGELISALISGLTPIALLGAVVATTLEPLIAVWLFQLALQRKLRLDRLRDVIAFLLIPSLFSSPIGATIAVGARILAGSVTLNAAAQEWVSWWISGVLGVLVITPVLLRWPTLPMIRQRLRKTGETIGTMVIFTLMVWVIFQTELNYSYVLVLFCIYVAFRLGTFASTLTTMLIFGIAVGSTITGQGPFASSNLEQSLVWLQTFLGTIAATSLITSALLTERQQIATANALLANVSDQFAASLDYSTTLRTVAKQTVEHPADLAIVDLIDNDQTVKRVAVAVADPNDQRLADQLYNATPLHPGTTPQLLATHGTVEIALEHLLPAANITSIPGDLSTQDPLKTLAPLSAMKLPISQRNKLLGELLLARRQTIHAAYSPEDLDLALELARRAAQTIDNAQLYRNAQESLHNLEHSLALLSAIVDTIPAGFAFLDTHFTVRRINYQLTQLCDQKPQACLDQPFHVVLPELAQHFEPFILRTLNLHIPAIDIEIHFATPSDPNKPRHLLASCYPVMLDNQATGIGILVVDRTQRNELERQLTQAQRMESIGLLAAGVAHDFNNLLTVISAEVELSRDLITNNPELVKSFDTILHSVQRAAQLTRQLLIFARHKKIEPQVVYLNELLLNNQRLITKLLNDSIRYTTKLEAELDPVLIDPLQFEQVLINLAVNARDAMPDGGQVTVTTRNVPLHALPKDEILHFSAQKYVALSIADTGIGMDHEVKTRVFEPFFTTKGEDQGTGLGLSLCYGIVRQANGHITLHSTVGHGTEITIYLPAAEATDNPARHSQSSAIAYYRGSETILLVEDDAPLRGLLSRALRDHGYRVIEASNGFAALQLFQTADPTTIDLVISDLVMPRMGGVHLMQLLYEQQSPIPALIISGYTNTLPADADSVLDLTFLAKPFSAFALLQTVRLICDRKRRVSPSA
jgi:signal transduction histidine kinase/integral membrane sensor domain MASE1/ActR/RegA family two-component response regulator